MQGGTIDPELRRTLERLSKRLPKFSDGRINYRSSDTAPVVTVFARCGGRILLMKRSDRVGTYKGKWMATAGYIDKIVSPSVKMLAELREEIGLDKKLIKSFKVGKRYTLDDRKIKKKFIVYPGIVELKRRPKIKLNFESTEYRWIKPQNMKKFDTVPKLGTGLKNAVAGSDVDY